jgi:hypothetical protein
MSKHKSEDYKLSAVKYYLNNITNSGNKYLYLIPYNPQLNPIEQYFNQIKHYLKYDELVIEIKNAIKQVKKGKL